MADTRWRTDTTNLPTATLADATEFRVVDDPAGTPTSKKTTMAAIKTRINALANTWAVAGAASAPAAYFTGAIYTAGDGTTSFPHHLVQPTGATAKTNWATAGTIYGANLATGFTGNFFDYAVAGTSILTLSASGNLIRGGFGGISWVNASGDLAFGRPGTRFEMAVIAGSTRVCFSSTTILGFTPDDGSPTTTPDALWVRGGAATFQFGSFNAATPVAQIVQSQGSRSGTDSNVGGGNLTIKSGQGTGTGTVSSLILQSPIAVASGTGAQTQTTGLTIKVGAAVLTSYTVAGLPAAATAGAGATAFVTDASTTLILGLGGTVTGGGSNKVPVYSDGSNWIYG